MWLTVASRSAPGASAAPAVAEPAASATAPAPATNQRVRNTLHLPDLVMHNPRGRSPPTWARSLEPPITCPSRAGLTLPARRGDGNRERSLCGRGGRALGAEAQAGGGVTGGGGLEVGD